LSPKTDSCSEIPFRHEQTSRCSQINIMAGFIKIGWRAYEHINAGPEEP
jgi:hypothetical protein